MDMRETTDTLSSNIISMLLSGVPYLKPIIDRLEEMFTQPDDGLSFVLVRFYTPDWNCYT